VVGNTSTDNGFDSSVADAWYGFNPLKLKGAKIEFQGLTAVSCIASMSCMAVGFSQQIDQAEGTFAETGSVPPAPPAPTITGFSPKSGPPGSTVHITGTHLLNADVSFNGETAKVLTDGANNLTVKVPNQTTKGHIQVTTPGGAVVSTSKFRIS
jgi:hypothetical protein